VPKQALSSSHMPKVAVLPFDNLGRTVEAEAFCDGLCEDITTELSRQASFDVVARNTMLVYKGSTVNIKDAGLELGARYVLEGSVRFAGPRVRVTAQLIRSETESHIWAERYDRTEEDVFTLQDELSRAIAIATTMQIAKAERERGSCAADAGRLASSLLKKGQRIWYRFDKASNLEARQTYEQALALEPDNYLVHISLAWTYCNEYRDIHGNNPEDAPAKAIEHAEKAVRLSDGSYNSYHALAVATACTGDMERAKLHISRALELNPNDTDSMMNHAEIFSGLGRHDKAVEMAEKSIALNEKYPSWYLATYANVLFEAGRFEDSLKARFRFVAPNNAIVEAHMAICLYALGRTEEATQHVERAMLNQPDARASSLANRYYYPIENRREEVRCMFVELGFPD
jgi:adenylate cyclase